MAESEYRIRWAIVSHSNGHRVTRERMCLAERLHSFLGLKFWFPFQEAEWRWSEDDALRDIERERSLRAPLPTPRRLSA